jgi:hypothetical protein
MDHWNVVYQTVSPPITQIQFPNEDSNGYDKIKEYVSNTCATLDKQSDHGAKEAHLNLHNHHYERDFIVTLCRLVKDEALFNKGY